MGSAEKREQQEPGEMLLFTMTLSKKINKQILDTNYCLKVNLLQINPY